MLVKTFFIGKTILATIFNQILIGKLYFQITLDNHDDVIF